jgi:putative membrane protein
MRLNPVWRAAVGIAAAVLAVAAGAQAVGGADRQRAASSAAPANKPLVKADQKILADMASGNMAEIELAKLADTKSRNDPVKTYARQMIDDHTRALTDITQFATARNVTLPAEVDDKHKATAAKLAGLTGDAFDQAYMKEAGVADHKKMHAMLATAHKKASDPGLKALVARLQPTVEQHLKAAQQMKPGKADVRPDKMPAATAAGH